MKGQDSSAVTDTTFHSTYLNETSSIRINIFIKEKSKLFWMII